MRRFYFWALLLLAGLVSCKTATPEQPTAEEDTILDAYWMLLSLEGQSPQAPNNTRTAFIRLQEGKNDLKGFTGCNALFGKYELNGSTVRFSALGSTRMMCPIMEQETRFLRVLERVDSYSIADRILTLYAGGEAVATFRTGNREDLEREATNEGQ
ncbi:MAG TPA: META domain-containing protein [Pontibacter sp.]